MKLWTIQPTQVYEEINQKGYYICDKSRSELLKDESFKRAYDWLAQKMILKIGKPPEGVIYPVWAWHTRDWQHKKPDLRYSGYDKRGTPSVCLEIEIPDNEVLLTDFEIWHYVLNGWHYAEVNSQEELDRIDAYIDSLPENIKKEKIEQSWENVFNIIPLNTKWTIRGRDIQATFWKLEKEQIKKVRFFTAK